MGSGARPSPDGTGLPPAARRTSRAGDVFTWRHGLPRSALHDEQGPRPDSLGADPRSVVTTLKNTVDHIVTEYGVAALRGASIDERARRLIAIAHPTTATNCASTRAKRNSGAEFVGCGPELAFVHPARTPAPPGKEPT